MAPPEAYHAVTHGKNLLTAAILAATIASASAAPNRPQDQAAGGTPADGGPADLLALGESYLNGRGVTKDHATALTWFRKAADAGDSRGLAQVGSCYFNGWGVRRNFDIATAYYKASASMGDPEGQYLLGRAVFSGLGTEQSYAQALALWQEAADQGHADAKWRLSMLYAAGEHVERDLAKAEQLSREIAAQAHTKGMVLLGELLATQGKGAEATDWWRRAADAGSPHAKDLLALADWRSLPPVIGERAFIEGVHFYQGRNNCGPTSLAMLARHLGLTPTPYDIKRLCPKSRIGTGTDWEDLVATGKSYGQEWNLVLFDDTDQGFTEGLDFIRKELDAGRLVVIDFTWEYECDGRKWQGTHTLTVAGYCKSRDQVVLRDPNQPAPGIQIISSEELKSKWHSDGYSRLSKGASHRPLIVYKARP